MDGLALKQIGVNFGRRSGVSFRHRLTTQVQLAELMGVAQQTYASWEVGRSRVPVASLPRLARALAVTTADLIGEEAAPLRRGPAPRLLQQIERIQRLPKSRQRFIMEMIDTALQANVTADAAE